MPTTSNFGWTTPADTDLVKDGAAAIRTLGNGIDTSLVDLKGGTTGQNLRKASNTDLDFTFAGDATNTVVDAAGDLLYGTAADTLGRLAIGTAGQVLKVNSGATAPEWGTASATPTFVGCFLTKSVAQSTANNTLTAITFDTEELDTDGFHSTVSNTARITIPSGKGGKYLIIAQVSFAANTTGARYFKIIKNGGADGHDIEIPTSSVSNSNAFAQQDILDLAATDYIEIYAGQSSGGSLNVLGDNSGPAKTRFAVTYLGA